MSTEKQTTNNDKITEGSEIRALFKRPDSTPVVIETEDYGKVKFVLRPMNNDVYAQMGAVMDGKGLDLEKISGVDGLKVFSTMYYPAMKVVFPYCCVSPKVIDGDATDPSIIPIKDLPFDVCLELFRHIMDVSGISEKAEKNRKN